MVPHMSPTPDIKPCEEYGKGAWMLQETVKVGWEAFNFEIPGGYVCDMGSVPLTLRWLIPPTGKRTSKAFLAHDFVYDGDQITPKDTDGVEMLREEADDMMRNFLELDRMVRWKRFIAWRGVRRVGWLSWKKETVRYLAGPA